MPASPDPDLTITVAKTVADLYGDAAARLLELVAERLARGIDQGWAERKLLELVDLRDDAKRIVDELVERGPEAITEALERAYRRGIDDAAADGITAGLPSTRTHTRAVEALAAETIASTSSTHEAILRQTLDIYRAVVAETAGGIVTGADTRRQAAQRALDRFADRGIVGFVDRAGRRWELESYVEMALRTASGRAQVAGTLDRFLAAGRDLVIVSDHAQECRLCRPWEGRVLSITGASAGAVLEDGVAVAGTVDQARAAGLLHANCRHSLTAYIPGLTEAPTGTADPVGDRLRQEQRRLERGVRQWKRRAAAAITDDARRLAAAKVREWQTALRDHVDEHGLKRLLYREQIGAAR